MNTQFEIIEEVLGAIVDGSVRDPEQVSSLLFSVLAFLRTIHEYDRVVADGALCRYLGMEGGYAFARNLYGRLDQALKKAHEGRQEAMCQKLTGTSLCLFEAIVSGEPPRS